MTTAGMYGGLLFQSAGVGMKAGAGYAAATAENMANRYNEMMYYRNAQIADIQALEALKIGRQTELDYRRGVRQVMGSQRAAAAASGVSVYSGSIARVQRSTIETGEIQAQRLRRNAEKEAWMLRMQALNYRSQAEQAHAMRRSPGMAMAAELIGGFGQVAMSGAQAGAW